jgi:uncharacterized protein YegL
VSQEGVEEELHHQSLKDVVPTHALYSKTCMENLEDLNAKLTLKSLNTNQAKDSLSTSLDTQHVQLSVLFPMISASISTSSNSSRRENDDLAFC